MIFLGFSFLVLGLLYLFAKDTAFAFTKLGNSMAGRVSERTEAWEITTTIGGILFVGFGLFTLYLTLLKPLLQPPTPKFTTVIAIQQRGNQTISLIDNYTYRQSITDSKGKVRQHSGTWKYYEGMNTDGTDIVLYDLIVIRSKVGQAKPNVIKETTITSIRDFKRVP